MIDVLFKSGESGENGDTLVLKGLQSPLSPKSPISRGHWQEKTTPRLGLRYRIWVREKPMIPIAERVLDCSFYLYKDARAALRGDPSGGCGFFVHIPSEHVGWIHPYAVTNKHVLDQGFHVLRVNTADGKTEIIESNPLSWVRHPDGDDVAVLPIDIRSKQIKWFSISIDIFMTKDIIADYSLRPGDEAFMIGRLVTVEGTQKNTPVVRFGNLAMMANPNEPIMRKDGVPQESFLVECRSLSGFSGSPVFLLTSRTYRSPDIPRALSPPTKAQDSTQSSGPKTGIKFEAMAFSGTFGPWLLGIDWGPTPLWRPVYEENRETPTQYQVEANTGMACVIPAWRIRDVLHEKELVKQRREDDREITRRRRNAAVDDAEES